MDALTCSIQALIACFSWQNLYISGAAAYEDVKYYEVNMATNRAVAVSNNPQFDGGIGFRADLSRKLTMDFRIYGHRSSFHATDDRGVNYVMLRFDWRPFRH